MSAFLTDAWYMAGWSDELTDIWLARTLLNRPILLYRKSNGDAVAIGNRCPHRFAPLNRGTQIGDLVECGYHGLRFDSSGRCVFSHAGDGYIPPNAQVPSYPIQERDGILWIWMGRPESAEETAVPDYRLLSHPEYTWRSSGKDNRLLVRAHYQLVIDNLLDLTHTKFLHRKTLAANVPAPERGRLDVVQTQNHLDANLFVAGSPAPFGGEGLVDQWIDMRWQAPGAFWLRIGQVPAGTPANKENSGYAIHVVTPETDTTTHYYYGVAQPGGYSSRPVAEAMLLAKRAFEEEDEPMLQACQQMMGTTDLWSLKPLLLKHDRAAALARRTLERLIAEEASAT